MIVNSQKKIEFINDCNCIVDYKELEKAIVWNQNKPTSASKHIYMHGNYPAVTINKNKIHIHRLLMNYWLNTKLPTNFFVHHINENKLDARKENLAVIFITTHQSKHNKGKKITEEQRNKIIISNRKRRGLPRKKQYIIKTEDLLKIKEGKVSINKIAKKYNCDWSTINARLYDNPSLLKGE